MSTDIVDNSMYVLMQTFFKLRSMIGDSVELQSYKFHFDDLDFHKEIVFDFVSDFCILVLMMSLFAIVYAVAIYSCPIHTQL